MIGRTGHRGIRLAPLGRALTGVRPLAAAPKVITGLAQDASATVTRLARSVGLTGRGVWSCPGRYHIEVRGVSHPGSEKLIRRVETALERIPGVAWARVNAPTGRVIVAVQPPEPRLEQLITTIAAAERADDRAAIENGPPPHPPEEGAQAGRTLATLAADTLGLGVSALTRVLPLSPLPAEVAGLLTAVDLHPKLHALVDRQLPGDHRAETAFPLVGAVVQGLTGGWAGLMLDGAQRILQWREARAQLASWTRVEPELAGTPERAAAPPPDQPRPGPEPSGLLDRYVRRTLEAGLLIGAAALPFGGSRRVTSVALAMLAKAPLAGREGYAAELGRLLASRGVIVMDRKVLRELDRIDTLLIDERVLRTGRGVLTELIPLPAADADDSDTAQLPVQAFSLFDPERPDALVRRDGWQLGPLDQLPVPDAVASAAAAWTDRGTGTALGLLADGKLVAVLRAEPESIQGMDLLTAAARRAGLRLILNDGNQLVSSVRSLQNDGATVMLISAEPRALGAADCGLGLWSPTQPPPTGAHLLIGAELAMSTLIVSAVGAARALARRDIAISGAGSALGILTGLTGSRAQPPNRALNAVNAAGAIALANGIWQAQRLANQPVIAPPASPVPWHLMPVDTVLARLGSTPDGLTTDQVRQRTGPAADGVDHRLGFARAFADELDNPLTPVLAAGAGLSAAVGSIVDSALVGGVIGVSALLGAAHRIRTERALADLLSRAAVSALVRRDGTERVVPAAELIPGDVVLLTAGDSVPADCRIIEADGLEADESSLTGESLPVGKTSEPVIAADVSERRSMLYEGTTIAAGRGVAVVVAVGAETEAGRGLTLARQAPPDSGVGARLTKLTRASVPLAAGSAVAVAAAGLLRGSPPRETVATAANLAVAAVPEGLPFLVSAAQLAAARRLAEHGALVRNPRTIEALGRVDVLCFDKTGTLTEGRLLLAGVGDGDRHAAVGELTEGLRSVLAAAVRATPVTDDPETCGQQTDRAVLLGADTARVDPDTGTPDWRPVRSLPFEPSRGYHATVGSHPGGLLLSVKGAPETVLPRCRRRRGPDGEHPLDEDGRQALHELIARHAGAGRRVLVIAEGPVNTEAITEEDVTDLTFVGYLTLADGVRQSAAPAVARIRAAGVHTIMITGDHPATATAIAEIIGSDGDGQQRVLSATELDHLDDDSLAERLARTDVVARCTPAHKVRIIQTLQRHGRTVAMTGDGANDAPAIRLADVGIALGQRGTPAARAAADLVVTDDRLETIIATLVEGRAMWSSVRHALSVLLGGNLGEIAFSLVTAAATGRAALNGRQLLLVNLLTDLAPAMAIAVRSPRQDAAEDLLTEGPDHSLGESLTREIAIRAATTTLGATSGWTLARLTGRRRRASTIALASLVGTQLSQTLRDGGAAPPVLAATAGSAALLAAIIQTPGVSHFFGCTPLGPVGWSIATGSALGATLTGSLLERLIGVIGPTGDDSTSDDPTEDDSTDDDPTTDGDTIDRRPV